MTSYDFQGHLESSMSQSGSLSILDFQQSPDEKAATQEFTTRAMSYCALKNALPETKKKDLVGIQDYFGLCTNAPSPEIGHVKYIALLDEVAESKDT